MSIFKVIIAVIYSMLLVSLLCIAWLLFLPSALLISVPLLFGLPLSKDSTTLYEWVEFIKFPLSLIVLQARRIWYDVYHSR